VAGKFGERDGAEQAGVKSLELGHHIVR
jgi:hypothetical protein